MSEEAGGSNTIKAVGAILVILIACGWTFSRARSAQVGGAGNNGIHEEDQRASPEEIHQMNHDAAVAAGLSADQQKTVEGLADQMAGLWQGDNQTSESRAENFKKMQDIRNQMQEAMSPDQQKDFQQNVGNKMRAAGAKRNATAKAALSDDQYKRYQEKQRERRAAMGGGRPGGGGGGGGNRGGNAGGGTNPPSVTPR